MLTCPHCLRSLPRAKPPSRVACTDDLLLCPECLGWSLVDDRLELRRPTEREQRRINGSATLAGVRSGMIQ
jgi:hypothetical protein